MCPPPLHTQAMLQREKEMQNLERLQLAQFEEDQKRQSEAYSLANGNAKPSGDDGMSLSSASSAPAQYIMQV